jgi:galactosyl transferase GMA12/MNN10 family
MSRHPLRSGLLWVAARCSMAIGLVFSSLYSFLVFPITWMKRIRSGGSVTSTCTELLLFLTLVSFLYWILSIVHTETYVFQCTKLGSMFRPVRRNRCIYSAHTLSEFESNLSKRKNTIGSTHSGDLSASEILFRAQEINQNQEKRKLSIGMLYLYDGSATGGNGNDGGESWAKPLMDRVVRNRREYCGRHGYTLINANHLVDRTRPAAWSKLKAMDYYLSVRHDSEREGDRDSAVSDTSYRAIDSSSSVADRNGSTTRHQSKSNTTKHGNKSGVKFDYILYIDMDVIIMNLDQKLEDFLFFHPRKPVKYGEIPADTVKNERYPSEAIPPPPPSGPGPIPLPVPLPHFVMTEDWKGKCQSSTAPYCSTLYSA